METQPPPEGKDLLPLEILAASELEAVDSYVNGGGTYEEFFEEIPAGKLIAINYKKLASLRGMTGRDIRRFINKMTSQGYIVIQIHS